jgi:CTP synthase
MKKTKYIFVTGGVLSGLGKGVTAASIGNLLVSQGFKVWMQKFDQYLNVDAGTLNPNEHGEVFVLDDGAETDLDLGHYERFINTNLNRTSSVMSGQIYKAILENERTGKFLGKTIQVIPHVTDEVKDRLKAAVESSKCDVLITEIGGTIGDFEGLHFVEAIRQMQHDAGRENVLYVHVGFLPHLGASDELKTKPIQNSVHNLQSLGIQPDILVCRSDHPVDRKMTDKIALFTGIDPDAVVPLETVSSIYQVPIILQKLKLDKTIARKLKLKPKNEDNKEWAKFLNKLLKPKTKKVKIALIAKYLGLKDTYFSVTEALKIAGVTNDADIEIGWIDAEEIERNGTAILKDYDGILVPGGFGSRGIEGKIAAIKYAREKKIPFLGLCYGLQLATIEFARNVAGLKDANTTEIDAKTPNPVIHTMPEQVKLLEGANYGGTMRLGAYDCKLVPDTISAKAYKQKSISERHRHRYEFNNDYREILEKKGLVIAGTSPNGNLVEIVELPSTSLETSKNHPFFVATQFHPEFICRPLSPHPLFVEFIKTCLK